MRCTSASSSFLVMKALTSTASPTGGTHLLWCCLVRRRETARHSTATRHDEHHGGNHLAVQGEKPPKKSAREVHILVLLLSSPAVFSDCRNLETLTGHNTFIHAHDVTVLWMVVVPFIHRTMHACGNAGTTTTTEERGLVISIMHLLVFRADHHHKAAGDASHCASWRSVRERERERERELHSQGWQLQF